VAEAAGAVPVHLARWVLVELAMTQAYFVSTVNTLSVATFALANPLAEKHWEAEAVAPVALPPNARSRRCHSRS